MIRLSFALKLSKDIHPIIFRIVEENSECSLYPFSENKS